MRRLIHILLTLVFFVCGALAGSAPLANSSTKSTPSVSSSSSAVNTLEAFHIRSEDGEYLEALFAPDTIPHAGIAVLGNALGDIIRDSVIDVRDLLRMRDITIGRPPAPTAYELNKGDLNRDGKIDGLDVVFLRDILLKKKNPPYIVDKNGGDVMGAGVVMHFDSGSVNDSRVLRVENLSASDIESSTGVNFLSLQSDSNYFMKAFELVIDSEVVLKTPSMTVALDTLPPCNLNGSNLLLNTGVGPFGEPQLIPVGMLAKPESTYSKRRNIYSNNEQAVLIFSAPARPNLTVEQGTTIPGGLYKFRCKPSSHLLYGNQFEFSLANGKRVLTNPISASIASDSISEILEVPAPYDDPSSVTVRFKYAVSTSPWSNTQTVNLLSVPSLPISASADSIILTFFALSDTFLSNLDYWLIKSDTVLSQSKVFKNLEDQDVQLMSIMRELHPLVDTLSPDVKGVIADIFYANSYLDTISAAVNFLQSSNPSHLRPFGSLNSYFRFPSIIPVGVGAVAVGAGLVKQAAAGTAGAAATGGAAAVAGWAGAVGAYIAGVMALFNASQDYFNTPSPPKWEPDPTYPYPQYKFGNKYLCMNAYRHNTDPTLDDLISGSIPPFLESIPLTTPKINYFQRSSKAVLSDSILDLTLPPHPFSGAIITPSTGSGIQGVYGLLNDVGVTTIPGIRVNQNVHFSLYDPKTGLFDPDIGGAVSPGVPEQGIVFPVIGIFGGDTTIRTFPIRIGEWKSDSIALNRQRVEYSLNILQTDLGKALSFGFRSAASLLIRILDPKDSVIIENGNSACLFSTNMVFNQSGTYKIKVAFGTSTSSGSFTVGVSYAPYPPIPYLCGNIPFDSLYAGYQYLVADDPKVATGDTTNVQAGTTIDFIPNGKLTGDGILRGAATQLNPIVLRPASGTVQAGKNLLKRLKPQSQVAEGRVKK